MSSMLAAVLHNQDDLRIEEVPVPEIADDEALLRCRAVAICGTDQRIYRFGHKRLPSGTKRILGHELAGEIAQLGNAVTHLTTGMRVAVAPNFGCGTCPMCLRGWFHMCPDYGAIGLTADGAYSPVVPFRRPMLGSHLPRSQRDGARTGEPDGWPATY